MKTITHILCVFTADVIKLGKRIGDKIRWSTNRRWTCGKNRVGDSDIYVVNIFFLKTLQKYYFKNGVLRVMTHERKKSF